MIKAVADERARHPSLKAKSSKSFTWISSSLADSSSNSLTSSLWTRRFRQILITHTFSTSTPASLPSNPHSLNDRGFDNCEVYSWAAVHGEIEIKSTKSFMNEDKYQYLDSSLKHAWTHTHTGLMVLHTNVQQSPGSHFTVVNSGTSMHILQYRLLTSNLSEDSQATCLKIMQSFPGAAAT